MKLSKGKFILKIILFFLAFVKIFKNVPLSFILILILPLNWFRC